jgi:hypothetical protein
VPENPPPNCSSRAPRARCPRWREGTVTPKGEPRTEARISETVSRSCQALFGVHPSGCLCSLEANDALICSESPRPRHFGPVTSAATRPKWLCVDRLFGEHGVPKDSSAGRQEFARRMELRRAAEDGLEFKSLLRGWCVGREEFRKELLQEMRRKRADHYEVELRQADEAHARELVAAELRRRNWTEDDLMARRKGDPEKVKVALRLRQESTMSLKWIAQRLKMGAWTHDSNLLVRQRKKSR